METLRWMMELQDRLSGPANAMASRLAAVEKATASLRRATAALNKETAAQNGAMGLFDRRGAGLARGATGKHLDQTVKALGPRLRRELSSSTTSVGEMSSGLSAMGGVALGVAAAATAAAMAIAGIGVSAGRSVVSLAGFQQSAFVTNRVLLGSNAAASSEFSSILNIARLTPFDTRDVISMRRGLVAGGFHDANQRDVLSGLLADVSALNPQDSTVMQRMTTVIQQIRSAGQLRGQELLQLDNAGVGRGGIFAEIARSRHLSGSEAQQRRSAMGLVSSGRVNSDEAIRAIINSVLRMTNTTRVGQFATAQSSTIPGLLSTLESSIPELLMGGGDSKVSLLFESPGLKAFKGLLTDVIELLKVGSPTGNRLQKVMRGLIDDVGGMFAAFDRKDLTYAFFLAIRAIEGTIAAVKILFKMGQALGGGYLEVLGPVLTMIGQAAGWLLKQFSGPDSETAMTALRGIGILLGLMVAPIVILGAVALAVFGAIAYVVGWFFGSIGDSISGISDEWDDFKNMLSDLWDSIPGPIRTLLEFMANPLGGVFDFNVNNADALAPAVNRTVDSSLARGGARATTNNTQIVVNAPGATPETANAVAGAVDTTLQNHRGDV